MATVAATLSLNVPAITALCKGEAGNTILNGTVTPTGLVGNEGDFFLNTSTGQLFGPKVGGLWPPGIVLNNSALAPNWNSVYTTVRGTSGTWNSSYTTTNSNSARWESNFNTTNSNSARWESSYTTTRNNSAVFTQVQVLSSRWTSAYNTVSSLSGSWRDYDLGVRALTSNWQSAYTTVFNTSASWGTGGGGGPGADLQVRALTARWESNYTTTNTNSARWESSYTTLNTLSAEWDSATTIVGTYSGEFESSYSSATTVYANSGFWNQGYNISIGLQASLNEIQALSSNWTFAYNNVLSGGQNWTDTATVALSNTSLIGFTFLHQLWTDSSRRVQILGNSWTRTFNDRLGAALSGWDPLYANVPSDIPFYDSNRAVLISQQANGAILGITSSTANIDISATLPSYSTAWPNGAKFDLLQLGTTQIYVSAAPGITINANGGRLRTRGQYTVGTLLKTGVSTWVFYGDTVVK